MLTSAGERQQSVTPLTPLVSFSWPHLLDELTSACYFFLRADVWTEAAFARRKLVVLPNIKWFGSSPVILVTEDDFVSLFPNLSNYSDITIKW